MDAVVALNPDNAFEARFAVRDVSTDAHAADALRSAALLADDPEAVRRCRAQATREKQLAAMHPAAMRRAGYWFKEVAVPPPPPEAPEAESRARRRSRG